MQVDQHVSNVLKGEWHPGDCISLDVSGCLIDSLEGIDDYRNLSCFSLASSGVKSITFMAGVRDVLISSV